MSATVSAIVGATALVGRELRPVPHSVVVLQAGRIVALGGARDDVEIPRGAAVEGAHGLTLAPGFIDAHVHIGFYEPRAVLAGGVTSARDLGWPPDRIFPLAARSRSPSFPGPTVIAAGSILTAPGGYPTRARWAPEGTGLEVDGPAEATGAVAAMAEAGARVIKVALNPVVGATPDADTLEAIVRAAHARALRVTAHVVGLAELRKALDAGIDELAHMLLGDEAIPGDVLERMVVQGVAIVPTLAVFFGASRRTAVDNLRRFVDAGGLVIYGTDLGNEGPRPGIDAREVAGMVDAAMSGRDVIVSATRAAAEWIGLDRVGVLAEGFTADLVAFDGDPLRDPAALTRVARVWRAGRTV